MAELSTPQMDAPDNSSPIWRLNAFLDKHILPYPVKFLTNRMTILATLFLLIPLIVFANVQVFVLATNSYLNVMSVVVSSTVLLYSTISEVRDRKAAQQREAIAQRHQKIVDDQVEANTQALEKIQEELQQHINSQLEAIQQILLERLDTNHADVAAMQQAIIDSANAQDKEVGEIKKLVAAMSN